MIKVLKIEEKTGKDGKAYYRVELEGQEFPLFVSAKPEWEVGKEYDIKIKRKVDAEGKQKDYYVEDKPFKASGFKPKARSPEEIHSIEAQVAIKEVGECWRVKTIGDNNPMVIAYQWWILDKLGAKVEEKKNEGGRQ